MILHGFFSLLNRLHSLIDIRAMMTKFKYQNLILDIVDFLLKFQAFIL